MSNSTGPPSSLLAYMRGCPGFTAYGTESSGEEDETETESYKQWFRSMGMMPP